MAETSKEDRQLPASEKRLQQARQEGNVPRSRDAAHLLVMAAGIGTLVMMGPSLAAGTRRLMASTFAFDGQVRAHFLDALQPVLAHFGALGWRVLVILLSVCAAAIAASTIPGGFNFAFKALGVKPSRLNPMGSLKRIFSLRNLVEFLKLALLASLLGAIGSWYVSDRFPAFAALSHAGRLAGATGEAMSLVTGGLGLLLMLLFGLALFDVPFQWFRHRADLRMTRDELKREHRESEGDPQLKGQIRSRQREAARRRMLSAVPSADIVVVNPTHYAVAIRYDEAAGGAPRVVAKGLDELAMRIQALARESGVPVLSAPPLARALYAHVELDQEIPQALYVAVAQVLVYVYQLRRWVPGRSAPPAEPVDLPVPAEMDPKYSGKGEDA
jgi:flagellar biosynthetic protein